MAAAAFFEGFDVLPDEVKTPDGLARLLVTGGVAPDAAVGWATRRDADGWVLGAGRASSGVTSDRDPEPIFDLASLTKPMTAFAVARSALRRESLLADVLDEAKGAASAAVPIDLLLAHRAGLEAHLCLYEPLMVQDAVDRTSAFRAAADARRADSTGVLPQGGFAPIYSDLGYILAGEALARAEQARDAGEVIERLVVRALGCEDDLGTARALARRDTDFSRRVRPTEIVAWRGGEVRGTVHDENAWALTKDGGSGHAGMFGTVRAVLAFGCAVLDAVTRGEGPLSCGTPEELGWLVERRPGGTLRAGFDGKSEIGSSAGDTAGPRTFGHLGFTGTSIWMDPDAESVVVVLTNRVHPTRDNVAIRAARPAVHDALFAIARSQRGQPFVVSRPPA